MNQFLYSTPETSRQCFFFRPQIPGVSDLQALSYGRRLRSGCVPPLQFLLLRKGGSAYGAREPWERYLSDSCSLFPYFPDISAGKNGSIAPGFNIRNSGKISPDTRFDIPGDNAADSGFRVGIGTVKLTQPGKDPGLSAQLVQRICGCIPGSAQRRHIKITDIIANQPSAEQFSLNAAFGRERINSIIRFSMTNQENTQAKNTTFLCRGFCPGYCTGLRLSVQEQDKCRAEQGLVLTIQYNGNYIKYS